jgi:hypothetical protein
VPIFYTRLTLGFVLELKTSWNQCWISIGLLTYPFGMSIWFFLKICIPWQYGYWNKNMKTHTKWYQYIQNLQFSHNGISIMVLKCVTPKGYIISIWICWLDVWCHKSLELFAYGERKKSLMNPYKTNKTLVTTKLIHKCLKILTNASLIKV